ncbi:retinoblastoma-like protein 2 [Melanotaenia boesemani]|uniref:retinoblastoma-like protein 2 n=1 Tax=Melanotaenia boesemani TaxID=1250792 RepID=UPI001C050151|nr:retinoblastoma-like protein 2 [Melanotaenia boesemani]
MATTPQSHMGTQRLSPSDFLITAFRTYPKDPTEDIKIRLRRMLQEFVQHCETQEENEMKRELVEKCCIEAEICYYKILEDIVKEPKWRADISIILNQELVQSCLVACCLDITVTSNQLPCDFTVLLQIFKLAAYHFPLVIGLVMWSWKDRSYVNAKHLHQVEIKILERLAWTSDSLLWKEIKTNDNRLPACQEVMSATQLEDLKRAAVPPEPDQPQAPASLEIPADADHRCSSSATTRPQKIILMFICKVYKLMAYRLSEMCSKLSISDELRGNIWTCFEYSLVHCSSLMVDSHLDQLLLYTIFNTTKITNTNLTLNDIVDCYKSQQYASKTVWEDMLILQAMETMPTELNDEGDHTGITLTPITPSGAEMKDSLIHFHREYRKKMQHFVQQFAPNFGGDTPQSPYPLLRKVSRRLRDNISVSLLTESNSTRTPGLCYYFGSSTSECLHEINSKVQAGVSHKRARCALLLDNVDEEDDSPSSRRRHLDGQCALERRLKSVVNDRAKVGNQD